jgi:uncharacterized protein with HEPN domain
VPPRDWTLRIEDMLEAKYPSVPWSRIRGMRHLLAHEYFGVNEEIIWRTATHDIAPLAVEFRAVLAAGSLG